MVLDDDRVSTNKGVEFLGTNEESLFHLGETFSVSLLSEVSFHSPFFPRLVPVDLSWEEALELSAKNYLCWAEAVEGVRSVAVLQESSGEPVGRLPLRGG